MRISKTITELRQQIHQDLRMQHPEWIEPTGECPECDEHEARLMKLLDSLPWLPQATAAPQRPQPPFQLHVR